MNKEADQKYIFELVFLSLSEKTNIANESNKYSTTPRRFYFKTALCRK